MAVKPILFSDEMVRAIIDGRKMQTRRVIKYVGHDNFAKNDSDFHPVSDGYAKPRYKAGDILWVQETWGVNEFDGETFYGVVYRATDPGWDDSKGNYLTNFGR